MDWKKAGNYALYIIPGFGMYDQFFRKSKGERNAFGIIGSSIYTMGFLIKLVILPAYLGKGVSTGDWHPFRFSEKNKTEQVQDVSKKDKIIKNQGRLEKNICYEEIIK